MSASIVEVNEGVGGRSSQDGCRKAKPFRDLLCCVCSVADTHTCTSGVDRWIASWRARGNRAISVAAAVAAALWGDVYTFDIPVEYLNNRQPRTLAPVEHGDRQLVIGCVEGR